MFIYLHGIKWIRSVENGRERDEHESGDARAQLEPDEVPDVVEYPLALFDCA